MRTQEAKELLVSVVNDFESNSTLPYQLARYCAKLGQVDQAKQWLGKALLAADGMGAVEKLRRRAYIPNAMPICRRFLQTVEWAGSLGALNVR